MPQSKYSWQLKRLWPDRAVASADTSEADQLHELFKSWHSCYVVADRQGGRTTELGRAGASLPIAGSRAVALRCDGLGERGVEEWRGVPRLGSPRRSSTLECSAAAVTTPLVPSPAPFNSARHLQLPFEARLLHALMVWLERPWLVGQLQVVAMPLRVGPSGRGG